MSNAHPCCLCSQIRGHKESDLIAQMLPGRPYVRRVVMESASFAVLPSLGPLAPGHSLLCPKAHVTSFAQIDPCAHAEYDQVKADLKSRLGAVYDSPIAVFEHGMDASGQRVLCTVDHAHMHFVPLPKVFDARIARDSRWMEIDGSLAAIRRLSEGAEYILYEAPSGDCRVLIAEDQPAESQYMRRMIAAELGHPREWNWKEHPDPLAADETWRRLVGA